MSYAHASRWLGTDGQAFKRTYGAGKTFDQLAALFAISRHQARYVARLLKLPPRVPGRAAHKTHREHRRNVLAALSRRPYTAAELASLLGASYLELRQTLWALKQSGQIVRQGKHPHSIYKLAGKAR